MNQKTYAFRDRRMVTMEFLTTGEKLKKLRLELGLKQHEIEEANITRSFISMVENNKKGMSSESAQAIAKILTIKAREKGIELRVDADFLTKSPKEEAEKYCQDKLDDEEYIKEPVNLDEIIDITKKYHLMDLLERAYLLKGNTLYDRSHFTEASSFYNEVLELNLSNGNEEKLAFIYNKLAKCKIELLAYHEGLAYLKKAYGYAIQYGDEAAKKNVLYNMSLCYKIIDEYDKSLENIHKLISICNIENEFDLYISAVIVECNCYISRHEPEKAIRKYEEVVSIFTDETHRLLGFIYNNLGVAYSKLTEFNKSMEYLQKAINLRNLIDRENVPYTLLAVGNLYMTQEDYSKALEVIHKAFAMDTTNNDKRFKLRAYEMLEKIYTSQNDLASLEKVYRYMLDILKDSNEKTSISEIIMKLSLLYLRTNEVDKAKDSIESYLGIKN
jgi:HTH-type transcriptional regulator, quorum sensing regulator NprR